MAYALPIGVWLSGPLQAWAQDDRRTSDDELSRGEVAFERRAVETAFGQEVSVRIVGELQALGFDVHEVTASDVVAAPPEANSTPTQPSEGSKPSARMVLNETAGSIIVEAWCPTCDTPLVQTWKISQGRSAETIAVQSVEALRASLLVYSRRQQGQLRQAPQPPQPFPPSPRKAQLPPQLPRAMLYQVTVGSTLSIQSDGRLLSPGAMAAFSGGLDEGVYTWRAGVRGGGSQVVERIVAVEGRASVSRWFGDAFVEIAPQISPPLELVAQLGVGVAVYHVYSTAQAGYLAVSQTHPSVLSSARVGLRLKFAERWSASFLVGLEAALDAPEIRFVERSVATLDAPAGTATLAVSLAL